MSKVIGNPTTTPMPQSNLMQTDSTKADYVKGKEQFIEEIKKVMPSQSASFEKTVSGTTSDAIGIENFVIAPIKIKTVEPNALMTVLYNDENMNHLGMDTIYSDNNGDAIFTPTEEVGYIWFSVICDFTVTYQVDINKVIQQVDKNTQDIASLNKLSEDFESALDNAIALCDAYINSVGGVAE